MFQSTNVLHPLAWSAYGVGLFASINGDSLALSLLGIVGGSAIAAINIWSQLRSKTIDVYKEQIDVLKNDLNETRTNMGTLRTEYDRVLGELSAAKADLIGLKEQVKMLTPKAS